MNRSGPLVPEFRDLVSGLIRILVLPHVDRSPSELGELTITCDRVLALYEGHVVGELSGAEITDTTLGALVVGAHLK